jgi:4'-phosphopantetheinyl transferase
VGTPEWDCIWAPGPLRPLLADGALHVWRADLTTVAADVGALLCEEERARAERFVNARDGELWRSARGLLRLLLGRYLDLEPKSLRFTLGQYGKPALQRHADETYAPHSAPADVSRDVPLSFNMSHSGELGLYAFAARGGIGVDVEVARRPIDELAIAARALPAGEAQRLQTLEPAARRREFLRAWTRHEATLKCLGVGIGGGGGDVRDTARESIAEGLGAPLWIAQLELGSDAAAAVATEMPTRELRRWEW